MNAKPHSPPSDSRIVRMGRWLTKRRSVLLSPLFVVALVAARPAQTFFRELVMDVLGLLSLWGGTSLRLVAASYHGSSHQSEPITAGPYAWVRHPLYVANFLIGLGILLVAGWWPMIFIYLPFFGVLHAIIARSEEVHLVELYGPKYERYSRAVPALLPWRPYAGSRYGSRNSFKLRKGQEWWKVFGYAAGVVAILFFKRIRGLIAAPVLPPLSAALWFIGFSVVLLAVVLRPRIRWAWLRACQTALATAAVLFMALQVPDVWPMHLVSPPAASAGLEHRSILGGLWNSLGNFGRRFNSRDRQPKPAMNSAKQVP